MKIWVKEKYELPELTHEEDGVMKGGFTLLESPAKKRIYEVDTSKEIMDKIKIDSKYETVEEVV